jgi:UDP-glucose 4-epimerase
MKETILITGGAGFIGLNLVDYILKTGKYKIIILDNLSSGNFSLLQKIAIKRGFEISIDLSEQSEIHFHKGDIRDKKLDKLFEKSDYIVHLAAQTGVIPSIDNPFKDAEINVLGTLNLLNYSVKHRIRKFIFSSSAAPLGEQIPPLDESKIPSPLSPYGASKLSGEGYCKAFYGSFGLNTIVLRFSNVYGIYSYHKGSVVAEFLKRIMDNKQIYIYGDGEQTRDFIYAEDLASVIIKAIEKSGIGGEIFQLGTGVETSVNQLVKYMKELITEKIDIEYKQERKGEIKRNYTSIKKAREILGAKPIFDLKKGLELTYKWFKYEK